MKKTLCVPLSAAILISHFMTAPLWADVHATHGAHAAILPESHAPIGVMGDHSHKTGEWMFSYRYMTMAMEDNLEGSRSVSPEYIVTNALNPYPGPPTLRVVPIDMTTQMHMFGLMYAPNDTITFMAMLNYIDKEMDHLTFMGMAGSNQLGEFTTTSSGIGDTNLSVLWNLLHSDSHNVHVNIGLSIPTGDIEQEDSVLTPMNTRPTLRLPYAMQLGSGTYDFQPGVTYSGKAKAFSWGSQYKATVRLEDNNEGYQYGDVNDITTWGAYRFVDSASASVRLSYRDEDSISGSDERIRAPVQTADPSNYGGQRVDVGVGINIVGQQGLWRGHRLALEYELPLSQDVNGIQMEMQSMLTFGYQYSF